MSTDASSPVATAPATVTAVPNENPVVKDLVKLTRARGDVEIVNAERSLAEFVDQAMNADTTIKGGVRENIKTWIKKIDGLISEQLDEILHNEAFQKLEATWRGLAYLVKSSETGESLKIRVLNVKQDELSRDMQKAIDFDQSALFKKVYEEEYGQLGGEPYGVLVGDYEFGRLHEDVELLKNVAQVAAMAHAPFVAAVAPGMFNMDDFSRLAQPGDLAMVFSTDEYIEWKDFRNSEDSRYVALTLPRVLARLPYGENFQKVEKFNYTEEVDGKDPTKYLWMNAAWAYTARLTDAYAKFGWLARTRGVESGGLVEDLPMHAFKTDDGDTAVKCPTEVAISDRREFELSNLGFLPLVYRKGTAKAVFMGAQSCQKPKTYFEPAANANAQLSAKFNLVLCASRFAHYLKVMARDRIGSFMEVADCSIWLNRWLSNYCVNPSGTGDRIKAERPLSSANVVVTEVEGKPGWYEAEVFLRPHFQLETLTTSLRLVAEIPKLA